MVHLHPIYAGLICWLVTVSSALGQLSNDRFTRLSSEDGLSQSITHSIIQDRYGFLWIGTANGLNRYDGVTFTNYRNTPGDSLSISDNTIRALHEDSHGNLWIGTSSGLNLLRSALSQDGYGREYFTRFEVSESDSMGLSHNMVNTLAEDNAGRLWIGTQDGLNRTSVLAEFQGASVIQIRFTHYFYDPEVSTSINNSRINRITTSATDPAAVWVATMGGGLNRLEIDANTATHYIKQENNPTSLLSNFIMTVFVDADGYLWAGSYGGGLTRMDKSLDQLAENPTDEVRFTNYLPSTHPGSISDTRIFSITQDHLGQILAGTFGGGLNVFNPETDQFSSYRNDTTDPNSLSNDFVRTIYVDRAKNLWLGTNKGVNKHDMKPEKFAQLRHDPHNRNSLQDNYVLSILEDSHGYLWVGTNKGLDRYNPATNTYKNFEIDHRNPRSQGGFVYALVEDRNKNFWVGTFGGGLYKLDRRSGELTQYKRDRSDPSSLQDNRITTMIEDANGRLWLGSVGGVCQVIDPDRGLFASFPSDPAVSGEFSHNRVNDILSDPAGKLWIGTNDGLNSFDPETETIVQYLHDPDRISTISSPLINALALQSDTILWIGTSNGLNRMNLVTEEISRQEETAGIIYPRISSILIDNRNHLWIATFNGLFRYAPTAEAAERFRAYSTGDGLVSNEFVDGSAFQSTSGTLYFGGINGINRFEPATVRDNPLPPPVALTQFKKFDKEVYSGRTLANLDEIYLTYADRFISFEFGSLDFTNPDENQHAYMLEGFDQDWVVTGSRRYVSYTNLEPGSYTLRVKASNNDGVWNETGTSLDIHILPPYWQTWWFRLLLLATVAALLFVAHRIRVSRLLALERVRTQIASDLHDDVGSTLTKISLYSDLVRTGTDQGQVENLLQNISKLSRDLIVTMSDIVWSIDTRRDTMEDLLDRMREFSSSLLTAANISYEFNSAGISPERKLPIETRQNIYLIFKEIVTNAARHSEASELKIDFSANGSRLQLAVHDNGTGIDMEKSAKGHGLRNMQMRADRINADITIENNNGTMIKLAVENGY